MKLEILPGIWIGTIDVIKNSIFLSNKNINNIINLDEDLNFLGNYLNYNEVLQDNLEKYEKLKFLEYLDKIICKVNGKVISSENIILVCNDNLQKSGLVVLIYLMKYSKLPKDICLNILRTKYPLLLRPYNKYENILLDYEKNKL